MTEITVVALSEDERQRLNGICSRVGAFCDSFHDIGLDLKELRDDKLYRDTCSTFEEFVRTRFGMQRSRAYQLMSAAATMTRLSSECQYLPPNERVCRSLNRVPESDQAALWKRLSEREAKLGSVVDTELMDKAVDALLAPNGKPKKKKKTELVKEAPATAVDASPTPAPKTSPLGEVSELEELEVAAEDPDAQPEVEDPMEVAAKATHEVLHVVFPKVLGYSLRIDRFLRGSGKIGIDTELIDNCMAQVHTQLELAERRCRS